MLTLITAAAVAGAQPTVQAEPMQMGQAEASSMSQMDQSRMRQMAGMKDCCCKDMMSKMHGGEAAHAKHQNR